MSVAVITNRIFRFLVLVAVLCVAMAGFARAAVTVSTNNSAAALASGIILGTGNTSQIPGSPNPQGILSTAGSGIGNGGATGLARSEYDIATFTFSFIPKPGVNRMSIASVFASEEYNQAVSLASPQKRFMLRPCGLAGHNCQRRHLDKARTRRQRYVHLYAHGDTGRNRPRVTFRAWELSKL